MHSDLHNILQCYLFYIYTLKLPNFKKKNPQKSKQQ